MHRIHKLGEVSSCKVLPIDENCLLFYFNFQCNLGAEADSFAQVITGQAAVQRCNATVNFLEEVNPFYPPTVNNEDLHEHFRDVAVELLGINKVNVDIPPLMGAEDFAFYQENMPGYFFWLGMQNASHERLGSSHSPYHTINEDVLPYGAALHASLAATYLVKYQQDAHGVEEKFHDEL